MILLYTLLLFFTATVLHWILWRIHLPQSHIKTIFKIDTVVALLGFSFILWRFSFTVGDLFAGLTLYYGLTFFYLVGYSALEADSPTLLMFLLTEKRGESGITREQMTNEMLQRPFIISRFFQLVNDGTLTQRNGHYIISEKGVGPLGLIIWYRNQILGKGAGG